MNEDMAQPGSALTDSAAGRILGVLVSPRATFESIARKPTWVLALLVLVLATIVTQMVIYSQIDMAELMIEQAEARGQDLDDEQIAQMEKFAMVGPACGIVMVPVGYAVLGLLLMVLVNLAGGEMNFHRAMAVATHGTMPLLIAGLLSILVVLAGFEVDAARMQLEGGVLTSNLAFLAPEGASPALVASLAAVDVFSIWNVVLLIFGVMIVGGVGTGAGVGVVGALWLLWVVIRVALTLIGGAGGG